MGLRPSFDQTESETRTFRGGHLSTGVTSRGTLGGLVRKPSSHRTKPSAIARAKWRLRHKIPDRQILQHDHAVSAREVCRPLVRPIATDVCDASVETGQPHLRLLPVVAVRGQAVRTSRGAMYAVSMGVRPMRTRRTERGQIVIPAALRKRLGMSKGQRIEITETTDGLLLRPLQDAPLAAARGRLRGAGLTKTLLEERRRDG